MVNDLLDLAKIEAGKIEVRPVKFEVAELFSALRGMLKPLLVTDSVTLSFEDASGIAPMFSDEAKISQIIRNFISNALKFTEQGQVAVSAVMEKDAVRFSVTDTGLGIAESDQELIFEEFSQIENRLQHKIKGTGLGLPLCRKLAHVLGGSVGVRSEVGIGSTFFAVIPCSFLSHEDEEIIREEVAGEPDQRIPVLVIEDNEQTRIMYERYLRDSPFRSVAVRSLREAEEQWARAAPKAIVLDIILQGVESWHWLAALKSDESRTHVPVLVATEVDDRRKALALGANAYFLKPLFKEDLLDALNQLLLERTDDTVS